jgi:hypothetical protein
METRLIIAYTLIALMLAMCVVGGIMLLIRQGKARRRDQGRSNR